MRYKPKNKPKKEPTKAITVGLPISMISACDALLLVLRQESVSMGKNPTSFSRTEVVKTALTRLIAQYTFEENKEHVVKHKHKWE